MSTKLASQKPLIRIPLGYTWLPAAHLKAGDLLLKAVGCLKLVDFVLAKYLRVELGSYEMTGFLFLFLFFCFAYVFLKIELVL